MIGHVPADRRRALESRGVAAVAVGRAQRIVVTDVAGGARRRVRRHVRAHQRESRNAVIERGRSPARGRVAIRAIRGGERRAGRRVHRLIRVVPIRKVALGIAALRRGNRQRIVVVDMALRALQIRMALGQQESRRAVVEYRGGPGHGVVAGRALGGRERSSSRRVDWIVRLLPRGQMALRITAIGRRNRQRVVVVDVALRALQIGVTVREQESGRGVIEGRRGPADRIMAGRALRGRKRGSRRWMDWIIGLLPGGQMADRVPAIGVQNSAQIIVVAHVAGGARNRRVRVLKQESRGRMIEAAGVCPRIERKMARAAIARGEYRTPLVSRIRRGVELRHVAAAAGRRKPGVNAGRRVRMALLALHHRVHAQQRKSIEVL